MYKNILQKFENVVKKYPDKIAFSDSKREISYKDILDESKRVATMLLRNEISNSPVGIFIDKSIECISGMIGSLYAGDYYTVIDVDMPVERIKSIVSSLDLKYLLTTKNNKRVSELEFAGKILYIEDIEDVSGDMIDDVRNKMIDTDIAYVLFTSGSTGAPKGTVISHKALLSYVDWAVKEFNFNNRTVFGSQTPLYFSMSITDFYSTLVTGATFHIIPKMYFAFPVKLIDFLNEKKVNTIYWVPSALNIVANFKTFDVIKPKYLKKVLFAGEVMPTKQLNIWIKSLPKVEFANLFGPTESTDICTFYRVNRKFRDDEPIPIGNACENCKVIIVNEKGEEASKDESGELYIKGSFLANGYYNNPEKTSSVFVQNPLNKAYPEIVYKTGDIVKFNEYNEIVYMGRKDFQIKHKGIRIELGEIESAANLIDGIIACAVLFDKDQDKIILLYQGDELSEDEVLKGVKERVPKYMYPDKIIKLKRMFFNANGKIDKVKLKEVYERGIE